MSLIVFIACCFFIWTPFFSLVLHHPLRTFISNRTVMIIRVRLTLSRDTALTWHVRLHVSTFSIQSNQSIEQIWWQDKRRKKNSIQSSFLLDRYIRDITSLNAHHRICQKMWRHDRLEQIFRDHFYRTIDDEMKLYVFFPWNAERLMSTPFFFLSLSMDGNDQFPLFAPSFRCQINRHKSETFVKRNLLLHTVKTPTHTHTHLHPSSHRMWLRIRRMSCQSLHGTIWY